jgi:hypothetical protein
MYHPLDIRLSDAFNAPAYRDSPFIPMKDAVVRERSTGKEVFRSGFLMVARQRVVFMMPKAEMQLQDRADINIQESLPRP